MNAVYSVAGMSRWSKTDGEILGWPVYTEAPVGDVDTCYIVGMYDAEYYDQTLANTQRARRRIIKWCGSDAMMLARPELLPEATHICDSTFLRRRLLQSGVDARVVQAATPLHPEVTPLPAEPVVGVYFGSVPENYGAGIVRFLIESMPDVKFHTYHYGQYTDEQMLDVIRATSVVLRLTSHDGSAAGTREYLEAGRWCVTTQEMPHTKQVTKTDPVGILRAVRSALKQTEPNMQAAEFYKYQNSAERFLSEFEEVCNG